MSALPQGFVDAMCGRLPEDSRVETAVVIELPRKRITEESTRFKAAKPRRMLDPTASEIAAVDAILSAEGIYLSSRSLADVAMEETTGSWAWHSLREL